MNGRRIASRQCTSRGTDDESAAETLRRQGPGTDSFSDQIVDNVGEDLSYADEARTSDPDAMSRVRHTG